MTWCFLFNIKDDTPHYAEDIFGIVGAYFPVWTQVFNYTLNEQTINRRINIVANRIIY